MNMNALSLSFLLICHGAVVRTVVAQDFSVDITSVFERSFSFDTGLGVPGSVVTVEVFNKCKTESPDGRFLVGELYPSSTVKGISPDYSGIQSLPGAGSSLSFKFVEGIAQNSAIYSDNVDDNKGKVEFCVQVNLFIGEDWLANFAEAKLTYNVDLITDISQHRFTPFELDAEPAATAEDDTTYSNFTDSNSTLTAGTTTANTTTVSFEYTGNPDNDGLRRNLRSGHEAFKEEFREKLHALFRPNHMTVLCVLVFSFVGTVVLAFLLGRNSSYSERSRRRRAQLTEELLMVV